MMKFNTMFKIGSMAMAAVLAELNQAHDETLRLAGRIAPERRRQAGTLPWYGPDYGIDDLIVYQYYGHKREHAAQVDVFRDHTYAHERASVA
jgi:hypothetical protein